MGSFFFFSSTLFASLLRDFDEREKEINKKAER